MYRKESSFHNPKLQLSNNERQQVVEKFLQPYDLTPEIMKQIRDVFEAEMALGLSRNPSKKSSLQMENTFIPELPDGSEEGEFLALDLGGTNFRVIMLRLRSGQPPDTVVKYYSVPEPLRLGDGDKLFDFLAECIFDFMKSSNLLSKRLPLGFCFSFPMDQKALDVGILVTWTKSFNCPGVVGKDAVKMLRDAIIRRGDIMVDVVAVVNDTTGTLMKGAFLDPKCAIGLVLGTGCNACYLEKVERIEKWEGSHPGINEVIVDIEWGAFGDNGVLDFIKTDADRGVDAQSLLVNSFTFEKLFAGKYIGELIRQILAQLAKEGLVFGGHLSDKMQLHNTLTATDVSDIEGEGKWKAREILERLGQTNLTDDDIAIVQYLCALTTIRGAKIVSVCLASVLDRMAKPDVTIAIDGSLYKKHPKLHQLLTDFTAELAPERKFRLMLADDGSGKGAGVVAAVADRLRRKAAT